MKTFNCQKSLSMLCKFSEVKITQQELERAIQEVWTLFKRKRIEKINQETNKRFKGTDEKIKEVTKSIAALTGKWEKFIERLIAPRTISMFKERGIEVEKIYQRVKAKMERK